MATKRSRHNLELDDFTKYATQLASMQDPELLLLKAHMLTERVLVQVLAARLREPDVENVPRLPFDRLVDLAIRGTDDRLSFVWLNALRNALAHEFTALDGYEFQKVIRKFGVLWPGDAKGRRDVVGVVADYVLVTAWRHYFSEMSEQLTLERAARLPENAAPYLEQTISLSKYVDALKTRLDRLGEQREEAIALPPPPPTFEQ